MKKMIINSSSISMNSTRNYAMESHAYVTSSLYNLSGGNEKNTSLDISESARDLFKKLQSNVQTKEIAPASEEKSPEELQLEILKRILSLLNNRRNSNVNLNEILGNRRSGRASRGLQADFASISTSAINGVWVRQTEASSFFSESESTIFSSVGTVKTADGKEINFGVSLEMSRSFIEETNYVTESAGYMFTDPLVINLESSTANVSDQKFLFDLDNDGDEEEISMLDSGSGYLALDKNNDGIINNGGELFGTSSGDGFKDLARYDKDNNNWIDEADEIWKSLRIWTKNEDGEDKLVSLSEAGIGALYLGNASTQFSLNNFETNYTNAIIRSTGIYLKENGTVGTIQHLDLET